ncbi:hypothetical protein ALC60_09408, partial [Trachymyrmex zeteki]
EQRPDFQERPRYDRVRITTASGSITVIGKIRKSLVVWQGKGENLSEDTKREMSKYRYLSVMQFDEYRGIYRILVGANELEWWRRLVIRFRSRIPYDLRSEAFLYLDKNGFIQNNHQIPIIYHMSRHKSDKRFTYQDNKIVETILFIN